MLLPQPLAQLLVAIVAVLFRTRI